MLPGYSGTLLDGELVGVSSGAPSPLLGAAGGSACDPAAFFVPMPDQDPLLAPLYSSQPAAMPPYYSGQPAAMPPYYSGQPAAMPPYYSGQPVITQPLPAGSLHPGLHLPPLNPSPATAAAAGAAAAARVLLSKLESDDSLLLPPTPSLDMGGSGAQLLQGSPATGGMGLSAAAGASHAAAPAGWAVPYSAAPQQPVALPRAVPAQPVATSMFIPTPAVPQPAALPTPRPPSAAAPGHGSTSTSEAPSPAASSASSLQGSLGGLPNVPRIASLPNLHLNLGDVSSRAPLPAAAAAAAPPARAARARRPSGVAKSKPPLPRSRSHSHLKASKADGDSGASAGELDVPSLPHIAFLTPPHLRKGKGGRQPAADPRLDPRIDPKKARRIMANRLSAAKSKMKQKSQADQQRAEELLRQHPLEDSMHSTLAPAGNQDAAPAEQALAGQVQGIQRQMAAHRLQPTPQQEAWYAA